MKIKYFYADLSEDVEKIFDTSKYEVHRPLAVHKNKKVIGSMKDELGGRIAREIVASKPKILRYLTDDGYLDKKVMSTKKCVIKREITFKDCKNFLENKERILRSEQRFKIEAHNLFTENIKRIALSSDNDIDRITSYPYHTSSGKMYKTELINYRKIKTKV